VQDRAESTRMAYIRVMVELVQKAYVAWAYSLKFKVEKDFFNRHI